MKPFSTRNQAHLDTTIGEKTAPRTSTLEACTTRSGGILPASSDGSLPPVSLAVSSCASRNIALLIYCVAHFWLSPVFGFSTDPSTLARKVSQNVALTNSPVTVTVTFTNAGLNPLRGFYYVEQMPSGLEPTALSMTLNGQIITNYTLESGLEDDVYAGAIPRRWVLELPPQFTQTNPVPAPGRIEIVYSLNSPTPGVFNLRDFSWVGFNPVGTNASFGYSEAADQQTLHFITSTTPPYLFGKTSTNGFTLDLVGVPGLTYVIEASTNLSGWIPLATNISPFEFKEGDRVFRHRFFRARKFP